jgi:hypothetical protein
MARRCLARFRSASSRDEARHRSRSRAGACLTDFLEGVIAVAVNTDGVREVVGMAVNPNETLPRADGLSPSSFPHSQTSINGNYLSGDPAAFWR